MFNTLSEDSITKSPQSRWKVGSFRDCSYFSGLSIQRHNRTQYDLIVSLPVKFQPKLSPTYGQFNTSKNKGIQDGQGSNKDPGKVLHAMGNADAMIVQKEIQHFFDMCVTQLEPSMQREFISKLETHAKNYQVDKDQIHQIILSDQCTIHPSPSDKIYQLILFFGVMQIYSKPYIIYQCMLQSNVIQILCFTILRPLNLFYIDHALVIPLQKARSFYVQYFHKK
ncbi:Hypothetical_protein [Hexamita inflata]|uniref:Hypothetical_protein n=1 Tax=Hexamita inflata TaxID=28002 RepID=A0AA86P9A5_9EUKA|nr:Hypothetical protein HINF_LOCUS21920 [Hexamita inflata]